MIENAIDFHTDSQLAIQRSTIFAGNLQMCAWEARIHHKILFRIIIISIEAQSTV